MKNSLLILSLLMLGAFSASAQKSRAVSLEIAGSGGFGSLNYEQELWSHKKTLPLRDECFRQPDAGFRLDFRAGFSFTPIDKNNGIVLIFPVLVHGIWHKENHGLDLGIGQSFSVTTKGNLFVRMPLSAGYRFEPTDRNYYLRFSYTPLISYLIDFQYQHWGGITFGYRFLR